jgi:hypothetical protein
MGEKYSASVIWKLKKFNLKNNFGPQRMLQWAAG